MLKRKLLPCSICNTPVLETWLGEQAERGLVLKDFCLLTNTPKFKAEEPRRLRYCIRPRPDSVGQTAELTDAAYARQGWRHVCTIRWLFDVYATDDPQAACPELDEAQAVRASRRVRNDCLRWMLIQLFLVASFAFIYGKDLSPLYDSFYDRITILTIILLVLAALLLLLLLLLLDGLDCLLSWNRVRRGDVTAPRRPALPRLFQLLFPVLIVIEAASLVGLSLHGTTSFIPIARTNRTLPLVTLELFEKEPFYAAPEDAGPSTDVAHMHWLLIPDEIEIDSRGMRDSDADWYSDAYLSDPDVSLDFHYYRLRTESLAQKLAQDEMLRTCDRVRVYQNQGFSTAYFHTLKNGNQFLCARAGDVVIELSYRGSGDVTAHLPELYDIVMDYRNS